MTVKETKESVAKRHCWEKPGAELVAPGVHRIPLPLPGDSLKAVNIYTIDRGDGSVDLIDGGWAIGAALTQLGESLSSIGSSLDRVIRVFVTHMHRDHYTLAVLLRRLHGTQVLIGVDERPGLAAVAHNHNDLLPTPFVERMRWHGADDLIAAIDSQDADVMEPINSDVWEEPDEWLSGGQKFTVGAHKLEVITTPGHTLGHSVFRERSSGLMFTGDHVLPHITPSVGFEAHSTGSPLTRYIASLRMLLELPDHRMLPAHGPVTNSVHTRVRQILEHHAIRLRQTYDAVVDDNCDSRSVAQSLTWTRHARRLQELPVFEQILAVNETAAHLDHLVEENLLHRIETQASCTYSVARPFTP